MLRTITTALTVILHLLWCVVCFNNVNEGSPAALDVTVISLMQQLTPPQSATTQGHALKVA